MTTNRWWVWLLSGLIMSFGGILALINPDLASLTAELLVGWVFLASGLMLLVLALSFGDRGVGVVMGLLGLIVGVFLLANPAAGMVSLTVILGVIFLVSGIIRLALAWGLRSSPLFWVLLIAGGVSVLLGAVIMADIQAAATTLLGVLLAIELLSSGVGQITYGLLLRGRR